MSAKLSPLLGDEYLHACSRNDFFSDKDLQKIKMFETREQVIPGKPNESCKTNLFFGFFFDGTRNNYKVVDELQTKNYSNVARLYDCYPGMGVDGVLPVSRNWNDDKSRYTNFFKIYVPGVATPFPQIKDTGSGTQEQLGAAMGRYAERRIIWALVQAINNVHRYFLKEPLVNNSEMSGLLNTIELNQEARRYMLHARSVMHLSVRHRDRWAHEEFMKVLNRLHKVMRPHWPDEKTGKCQKSEPGIVKRIYLSIFGFSRGATEARAFLNWLHTLCQLDARMLSKSEGTLTLGGFVVHFEFVGLFDTVASIGSANTVGILDGHGAWADAEDSLRIPPGIKCLHLVAAHELRRSFPVDSIAVGGHSMPDNCEEIVVPGVHSDVGGGYCPKEQGRGIDSNGADMLSRVPLLIMYKAARLGGVPLKLELADEAAKEKFELKKRLIDDFNAYIRSCRVTEGPIHVLMREQARMQMMWRMARVVSGTRPLHRTTSFLRASLFDQNDLFSAAQEFEIEMEKFKSWLSGKGKDFVPASQPPGFKNGYQSEWEEIATWWGKSEILKEEVLKFFDEYVHDSRAWFKLGGADSEEKMHQELKRWVANRRQAQVREEMRKKWVGRGVPPSLEDNLTAEQCAIADEYAKTGKIPRMFTSGREPFALCQAGYLRFRRIYGGWDTIHLS